MELIKNETNREIIFEKAITEVFKRISESVNEEEFRAILTVPPSINSKSKKFSKIFIDELNQSMIATLENIKSQEGSLTEGFKKLSALVEETSTPVNCNVWRPSSDVKLHLRSHNSEKIDLECQMLEKQISEMKMKNEEKIKEISKIRREIDFVQEQSTYWLNKSKLTIPHIQQIIDTLENHISSIDGLK